ncbi:MAG: pseudouridine synthase [Myxococcota bacterium]|nr:pseudouridine synthase [Myxococcota bacterium]
MRIPILTETENWVVVAKPPKLLTHGHPRFPGAPTLIGSVEEQEGWPVWIVHRLDRSASGCLILAKKKEWVPALKDALHNAEKSYLAIVRGYFDYEGEVEINKAMKVNGKEKEALSFVRCLGRCHEPRSSLLLVRPQTGRYHQVRRHVRDLHHPVLGDSEHGDSHVNRWWREQMGLKRLGLHAWSLRLALESGESIVAQCPLFSDQYDLFQKMPWWSMVLEQHPRLGLSSIEWPL